MQNNGMESRDKGAIMLLMAEMLVKKGLLSNAEKERAARILEREENAEKKY